MSHTTTEKQQLPRTKQHTSPSSIASQTATSPTQRPTRPCTKSLSRCCATMATWMGRHCRPSSWPSRCAPPRPGSKHTTNTTQQLRNRRSLGIRTGARSGFLWAGSSTALPVSMLLVGTSHKVHKNGHSRLIESSVLDPVMLFYTPTSRLRVLARTTRLP